MTRSITLKKGLDINIIGEILPHTPLNYALIKTIAIVPDDFPGITPKAVVSIGDKVKIGTAIIIDKNDPNIKLTSPSAGIVREIVRGERRKIIKIIIDCTDDEFEQFDTSLINDPDASRLLLQQSGLWAHLRQRPYDIVPASTSFPRDIFITAFDSAPLAPNYDFIIDCNYSTNEIIAGVQLLKSLTSGNIYISTRKDSSIKNIEGATIINIEGPHPAGNVGIQVANISPINKGENVWTLNIITLCKIGHLALTGHIDPTTIIAITGSEIKNPQYIKAIEGANIEDLLIDNLKTLNNIRLISGNVLTGHAITINDHLRFPYLHITAIPEGDKTDEFMGWASLSPNKMSVSRSFIGHFLKKKFRPDARILGSRRAMIMSGEYDKVLPMDIYAEYLLKAIISRNIDQMEALGIYEVAPEDFALCEYVDTSKIEIQKIVREGLDYLRHEIE